MQLIYLPLKSKDYISVYYELTSRNFRDYIIINIDSKYKSNFVKLNISSPRFETLAIHVIFCYLNLGIKDNE